MKKHILVIPMQFDVNSLKINVRRYALSSLDRASLFYSLWMEIKCRWQIEWLKYCIVRLGILPEAMKQCEPWKRRKWTNIEIVWKRNNMWTKEGSLEASWEMNKSVQIYNKLYPFPILRYCCCHCCFSRAVTYSIHPGTHHIVGERSKSRAVAKHQTKWRNRKEKRRKMI